MGMGLTAEHVAEQYDISREDQDEFAYQSHMKAAAATDAGKFAEEIVPVDVRAGDAGRTGSGCAETITFDQDEHLRRDTTLDALAKLKPVFKQDGTVTPGNSSPLSDGAAAVIVMEAGTGGAAGPDADGAFRRLQRGGRPRRRSWGSGRWRRCRACSSGPGCRWTIST